MEKRGVVYTGGRIEYVNSNSFKYQFRLKVMHATVEYENEQVYVEVSTDTFFRRINFLYDIIITVKFH